MNKMQLIETLLDRAITVGTIVFATQIVHWMHSYNINYRVAQLEKEKKNENKTTIL